MSLLQPIYAILVALPLCEHNPDDTICDVLQSVMKNPLFFWRDVTYSPDKDRAGNPPHRPILRYRTCLDPNQNHGNALMTLADVARMASITYGNDMYAMVLFVKELSILKKEKREASFKKCVHHASGLLQRSTFHLVLVGFLEISTEINLQVTLLAIQRAASSTPMRPQEDVGILPTLRVVNVQTLFSVVLGLLGAVKRGFDVYSLTRKASMMREAVARQTVTDLEIRVFFEEYGRIVRQQRVTQFGFVLYVLMLMYASAKFVAVFYCPSSLWNFSWWPPDGCVVLQ